MITLEYPYDSPTETLTLPSPQQSDPDSLQSGLVVMRTMTGVVYTYLKAPTDNLLLTIPNIKDTDLAAIRAFLLVAVGQDVQYTDTIGRVWKVNITNPMFEVQNSYRTRYTLTLQLEGVVI